MQLTAKQIIEHIQEHCDPDEELIVTIWKRSDYPETWDTIIANYENHTGDYLADAQGPIIDELEREPPDEDDEDEG